VARRARLIELLTARSFERKPVMLASGKASDFFIDCKQTILTAEGHALVAALMGAALTEHFPACEAVAGVELGGCPLASAVSLASFANGNPLDALYIRKEAKDHGTRRTIENDKSMRPGLRVVVLEDVITTGGSTLKAVEKLKAAGADVLGVIAIVDRLEGGAAALHDAGLPFTAICTRRDFIAD